MNELPIELGGWIGTVAPCRPMASSPRAAAFARAASLYPGYGGYAKRAGWEIPVVGLEATGG